MKKLRPSSATALKERNRNQGTINTSLRKERPAVDEYSRGLSGYEASLRQKMQEIEQVVKELAHDRKCGLTNPASIDSKDRTNVRSSTELLQQELREEVALIQKQAKKTAATKRSSLYFAERLRDFKIRHDATVKRVDRVMKKHPVVSAAGSTTKKPQRNSAKRKPAYPVDEADNRQPYPLTRPSSKFQTYRRHSDHHHYHQHHRGRDDSAPIESSSRQDRIGSGIPSLSDFSQSPQHLHPYQDQEDYVYRELSDPHERHDTFGRRDSAQKYGGNMTPPLRQPLQVQPPLSSRRLEAEVGGGGGSWQLLNQDMQHLRKKVLELDSEVRAIRALSLERELEAIRTKEVKMQAEINILRNQHSELLMSYHKLERQCNSLKEENKQLREQVFKTGSGEPAAKAQAQATPRSARPPRYLIGSNPPATARSSNPLYAEVGGGESAMERDSSAAAVEFSRVVVPQLSASKSYSTPGEKRGHGGRSSPLMSGREEDLSEWVLERLH